MNVLESRMQQPIWARGWAGENVLSLFETNPVIHVHDRHPFICATSPPPTPTDKGLLDRGAGDEAMGKINRRALVEQCVVRCLIYFARRLGGLPVLGPPI